MSLSGARNFTALPDTVLADIFWFLPARSLVKASLVCRRWHELANRELSRRKNFVSRVFKGSLLDIRDQLLEFFNVIDIVPSAVVMSCVTPNARKWGFSKLASNLPKNCILIGATGTGGIIGETCFGHPVEGRSHFTIQYSVLFIPKVEGVNINLFSMTMNEARSKEKQLTSKLNHFVDQDVKFMFLIGCTSVTEAYMNNIWSKINEILGEVVACGALASSPFAIVEKKKKRLSLLGLAIGGNIEAESTLHSEVNYQYTYGKCQQVLQGMAINQPLASPRVCFVMKCISLNFSIFDNRAAVFRKAFPNIRLFGFLGYGEIGTKSSETKNASKKNIMHYNNIVFGILKLL